MRRLLEDKLGVTLYSYDVLSDYDIIKMYYENYFEDKTKLAKRVPYRIPLIKMIANKLSTTMINSNLITNSKIFKLKPFKQFLTQYFGTGWSLITYLNENLKVFDWDKILIGTDIVIGWEQKIDGTKYIEIHRPGEIVTYRYVDGRLEDETTYKVKANQFLCLTDKVMWHGYTSQLKAIYIAYNNFVRDIYLGGKKVIMDRDLIHKDEFGNDITPDDVAQELFTMIEADMRERADKVFYEYNPDLRVEDNVQALSYHIGMFTSALGLGSNFIVDNRTSHSFNTVLAWSTSNQEQVDTVATYSMILKELFETWLSAVENHTVTFTMNYDFIIDRSEERKNDIQDIQLGIMSKEEYRVKWYGEDLETAKKNVPSPNIFADEI